MTKDTAQKIVNNLTAKSIGYMDQGHGHGHYGFNQLDQEEFVLLREALEVLGAFDQLKSKEGKRAK